MPRKHTHPHHGSRELFPVVEKLTFISLRITIATRNTPRPYPVSQLNSTPLGFMGKCRGISNLVTIGIFLLIVRHRSGDRMPFLSAVYMGADSPPAVAATWRKIGLPSSFLSFGLFIFQAPPFDCMDIFY